MASTILVTGADGFVGRALCPALSAGGHRVRRAVRAAPPGPARPDTVALGDIACIEDWQQALAGVDVIIHLAARAHVMRERDATADAAEAYRRTNVAATERLARAAVQAGTRRLVFVSSIKVNGESTENAPFRESDPPAPQDEYGRSKWQAEQHLHAVAGQTGLEIVVVRPPLVYGPGVKGNLARLLRALERGIPLPLGGIDNRRSLIGVYNLADALRCCAFDPAAAGETFLVSDGKDVSTPELIRAMAAALGRPARLLPMPFAFLRAAARLSNSGALTRLIGSLQVDSTHIRNRLGWQPPFSIEQGIAAMVDAYRALAGSLPERPL